MSVRDFRDLVAWQLADALRYEMIQFTFEGSAARDFRFRDDIRASAGSAPANIAEGFGRFLGVLGYDLQDFLAFFADEIQKVMFGGFLPQPR